MVENMSNKKLIQGVLKIKGFRGTKTVDTATITVERHVADITSQSIKVEEQQDDNKTLLSASNTTISS